MALQRLSRIIVNLFTLLAMLSVPAFLHAQGTPCGYATGNEACPTSCNYLSGLEAFQFVSTGGQYGIIADVYCGASYQYVQQSLYLTTPCIMESPVADLSPEAIRRLLALADGKEMLISSCGGFKQLTETPEALAQPRWKFPKVGRLVF